MKMNHFFGFLFAIQTITFFAFPVPTRAQEQGTEQPTPATPAEGNGVCLECLSKQLNPMGTYQTYKDTRKLLRAIYSTSQKNACVDFYSATCVKEEPKDPTGTATPMLDTSLNIKTYEQQDAMVKSILADWEKSDKTMSRDDFVIKEYYERNDFDQKLDKWASILERVKTEIIEFLKARVHDPEAIEQAQMLLGRVKILRNYKNQPGFLFETTAMSGLEISVGGNMLLTTTSEYAIAQTLAHEMGHNLTELGDYFFADTKKCIEAKFGKMKVLGRNVSTEEIWADWFSHQIYARMYNNPDIPNEEKLAGMKNALRFFCGYGGSVYGHPPGNFRMNFMASNPELKKITCKDFQGKQPVKEYCK